MRGHLVDRLGRRPTAGDDGAVLERLALAGLVPDEDAFLPDQLRLAPDLRVRRLVLALHHLRVEPLRLEALLLRLQRRQLRGDVRVDEVGDVATVQELGLFVVAVGRGDVEVVFLEVQGVDARAAGLGLDVALEFAARGVVRVVFRAGERRGRDVRFVGDAAEGVGDVDAAEEVRETAGGLAAGVVGRGGEFLGVAGGEEAVADGGADGHDVFRGGAGELEEFHVG